MLDLACALRGAGEDVRLLTALPGFRVDSELRPIARSRPARLAAARLAARIPYLKETNRWENEVFRDFARWFGTIVEAEDFDVVDAIDGVGLEAGTEVQRRGGVWICNRGSAHVLTQRELLIEEYEWWRQPMPREYFDPWMVERCLAEYAAANAIVVPSHFAKRTFLDHGFDPDRVHVCPYGVDLSMFRPEPKKDERFRALFVGTQSVQKGIGYLLEAAKPLVEYGVMDLWLAGSTPPEGRPILEHYAGIFHHWGVQPRSRLASIYSQASVLVLPSVQEGLALVQAQAMACGIPVIATYNTGAEDLFTDGVEGFIVPPRDPVAIRERLQFLLDNPERLREMGDAALHRVRSIGGWSRYGRLCGEMYRHELQAAQNCRWQTAG